MQIPINRRLAGFLFGVVVGLPYPLMHAYQIYLHDHERGLLDGAVGVVLIVGASAYAAFTYIGPRYSE